jgi:hypothetical protein
VTASLLAEWDNFYVITGSSAAGLTGLTFVVAAGSTGLLYVAFVANRIWRIASDYVPVREDWFWNVILPAMVYAVLLTSALLIWRQPSLSLYGVGAASVLLMFVGIHNAWDVAVWNSVRKQGEPSKRDEPT